MKPQFFKTPSALRAWMHTNHARVSELWIGFHKKDSGKPSVTYHEALDEALSVGWIDGVRKSLSSDSYVIRFTPRKKGSYWSKVNTARAKALRAQSRMTAAGLAAFNARDEALTKKYSFERETASFDAGQRRTFEANRAAWSFFQAQPPGYRKVAAFYVMSAKKEQTRADRLALLIDLCASGRRLGLQRPERQ